MFKTITKIFRCQGHDEEWGMIDFLANNLEWPVLKRFELKALGLGQLKSRYYFPGHICDVTSIPRFVMRKLRNSTILTFRHLRASLGSTAMFLTITPIIL